MVPMMCVCLVMAVIMRCNSRAMSVVLSMAVLAMAVIMCFIMTVVVRSMSVVSVVAVRESLAVIQQCGGFPGSPHAGGPTRVVPPIGHHSLQCRPGPRGREGGPHAHTVLQPWGHARGP